MAYETSAFGKADGSNVTQDVSNHYGAFKVGNADGVIKTEGIYNEATFNFDGDKLDLPVVLPTGAVVVDILDEFATGAITTATVGGTDISAADGTKVNFVQAEGALVIEGPTAGYVTVRYMNVAG